MGVSVLFLKLYPSQSERQSLSQTESLVSWEEEVWVTSDLQKPLKTTQNCHWQDPKAQITDTAMTIIYSHSSHTAQAISV